MMKKWLQKHLKNEKGLTLVELLAVIVILGIIAAIAVPSIGGVIENTKYNAVKADATNALNAANLYFIEGAEEEVKVGTLVSEGYLESMGKLTSDMKITKATKDITGTSSIYSGNKVVIFNTGATLEEITKDNQKGSSDGSKTIPKPAS